LVEMSLGNSPPIKAEQRSWEVLAVAAGLLAKWGSSKRYRQRFFPQDINPAQLAHLAEPLEKDARRIRRFARLLLSRVVRNRGSREGIALAVKSAVAGYRLAMKRKRGRF